LTGKDMRDELAMELEMLLVRRPSRARRRTLGALVNYREVVYYNDLSDMSA